MSLRGHAYRPPPVYVTEADYERLINLAEASDTNGARLLAEELDRAVIVDGSNTARRFVRLNSTVKFTDQKTGRSREVQVVPPDQADIDRDRLSVLTPVGAALIGLAAGASIALQTDNGRAHVLVVERVEHHHEPA